MEMGEIYVAGAPTMLHSTHRPIPQVHMTDFFGGRRFFPLQEWVCLLGLSEVFFCVEKWLPTNQTPFIPPFFFFFGKVASKAIDWSN